MKTLYSLCFFIACHLEFLIKLIKEEILTLGLAVHLDETKWPINNKKQSDGYMWVMSNQAGSYYQFEPTRSGLIARELLGSYEGALVVDGYSGYKQFSKSKKVVLAHCWANVRGEFTDIEKNYPTECGEILDLIAELFKIERKAETLIHLKSLREEESVQVIGKIKAWLMETKQKSRTETGLKSAINYAINRWQGLIKFLEDERIPLTNNEVERTIRHSVMGRKNFYGSKRENSGQDTTHHTSIRETYSCELGKHRLHALVTKCT